MFRCLAKSRHHEKKRYIYLFMYVFGNIVTKFLGQNLQSHLIVLAGQIVLYVVCVAATSMCQC